LILSLALLTRSTTGEVGLMLFALGVGEVGAVILVDCKTETALETSDVVLKEVGILVKVNVFQSKLAKTLATVCVGRGAVGDTTATEFGSCSILEISLASLITYILPGLRGMRLSVPGNPWRCLDVGNGKSARLEITAEMGSMGTLFSIRSCDQVDNSDLSTGLHPIFNILCDYSRKLYTSMPQRRVM
jgi:hypothetical protein